MLIKKSQDYVYSNNEWYNTYWSTIAKTQRNTKSTRSKLRFLILHCDKKPQMCEDTRK